MALTDFVVTQVSLARRLVVCALILCGTGLAAARPAPQADVTVLPDTTPEIKEVNPSQAAVGAKLTVIIQGSNFAQGVYVSSVNPALHVESSKRVSATQVEVQLTVSATAQPSTVSLLVSNPASRAAETAFKIVAGEAPVAPPAPAAPTVPTAPTTPAAPVTPAAPAVPSAPIAPSAPTTPATPATPPVAPTPVAPSAPATPSIPAAPLSTPTVAAPVGPPGPEVTKVDPPRVGLGDNVDLKITGKNFRPGAKVSFANPGIRALDVTVSSDTEISAHIKVERDASPSIASLYVINSDDSEAEAPFEVFGKAGSVTKASENPVTPNTPAQPAAPSAPGAVATQRYDAFHLGNPAEVLQTHGRVKGALVVSSGSLQYQEGGKVLINIPLSDIKEIKTSSIATATFHITLNSGKTYHFAPGSMRPTDARSLVDSLRKALPQP